VCYEDRLREYEREKQKLKDKQLSDEEYMRAIIKLANKLRV
jgi:lipase chaperone LimK